MAITLHTWAGESITPQLDAIVYDKAMANGIYRGCEITHTNSNKISISAGVGIIRGRLFSFEKTDIAVQLPVSGTLLGRIYILLDLSNTDEPIAIKVYTGSALPSLPIGGDDINFDNGQEAMELCTFTATATTLINLTQTCPQAMGYKETAEEIISRLVVLPSLEEVSATTERDDVVGAGAVQDLTAMLATHSEIVTLYSDDTPKNANITQANGAVFNLSDSVENYRLLIFSYVWSGDSATNRSLIYSSTIPYPRVGGSFVIYGCTASSQGYRKFEVSEDPTIINCTGVSAQGGSSTKRLLVTQIYGIR